MNPAEHLGRTVGMPDLDRKAQPHPAAVQGSTNPHR